MIANKWYLDEYIYKVRSYGKKKKKEAMGNTNVDSIFTKLGCNVIGVGLITLQEWTTTKKQSLHHFSFFSMWFYNYYYYFSGIESLG